MNELDEQDQACVVNERLIERAAVLGREHGAAAGSSVTFGNPTGAMSARDCLELADDPKWSDVWGPSSGPLSGEWADGMTTDGLMAELGFLIDSPDTDEIEQAVCDAYEDAYYDAWRDEVLRMARYQVGES